MPTFSELYKKNVIAQSGGVSFNDFYGLSDSKIKQRLKEEERQNKIAAAKQYAAELNANVSKNTVKNQSVFEQVKRFAPSVIADEARAVGNAVIDLPKRVVKKAQEQVDYFTGPTRSQKTGVSVDKLIEAQKKSQELPTDIKEKARSLGPSYTANILAMVSSNRSVKDIRKYVEDAQKQKQIDDRKALGTAAEVASLGFGGTGLAQAAKAGGKAAVGRALLGTAASGAVGGAGSAAQNEDATTRDILMGAGIGAGAGLALSGASAGIGKLARDAKYNKLRAGAITDEARMLPENAGVGARVFNETRQLTAGEIDPNLAVISRGADVNDVKQLRSVERKISRAQQTGNITATQARSLMKQRERLIERIQQPRTVFGQQLNTIDNEIRIAQEAGNEAAVKALSKERNYIEQQSAQSSVSKETADAILAKPSSAFDNRTKISSAAKNTEAKAISEELSKGFDGLPTYTTMNLDEQASAVVDFMNADYETAKKIALGQLQAPEGIQASSFYKGVESRAVREGDVELMERLATESLVPKTATSFGQYNAALAYKDPESPVTAFRSIVDARKASKLSIPGTITKEESEKIVSLAQEVASAKTALANGGDRYAYGRARIKYDDYVQGLIANANKKTLKDSLLTPVDTLTNIAGVSKSLRASLDNSSLLRQGWKTLFTSPGTWAKASAKSFADFVKTVGGKNVIDEVRADIMSRPNSLNGLYKKMGVDVFGITEEAFPSSLPERIPVAGRFFKASDAAYTGFQQRTRADLADKYLEIAQRSGVDLSSKKELKSIGKLVNSLTSRGDLGRTGERASKLLNNVFFSPRLLKSNIDILTAHQFQRDVTPFVRKQAAKNLLQIAVGSAAALKLAHEVTGGKTEWDPRSSNFGKIRIGDTRFDLSGGMGSVVTLGARIAKQSSKSSTTGEIKPLNSGEFGSQTTLDTIYNFFENKTSPAVSVLRDYLKGQDFDGNKPTAASTIKNLTLPLIINNYTELKNNPRAADILPTMIAESLGISVNTYGIDSNWNSSNAKRVTKFKEFVGQQKFDEANKRFNEQFNGWYDKVSNDSSFWKLPIEQREKVVLSKKDALTEDIFSQYRFKYKTERTNNNDKGVIDRLKKL